MSGPSTSQSGSASPTAPAWLQNLLHRSGGQWSQLLKQASPMLQGQLQANPEQIAQLTPQETALINELGNFSGGTPDTAAAEQQLSQLTSGPIGSSPDTLAAMRAYNAQAAPVALQAQSLSGSGRGGGITEALTMGNEAAYAPLVQQEVTNRAASIPQYQNLANLLNTFTQTGLTAAEMPQQVQQAGFEAAYQDLLRRYGLEQQATLGPLQTFGGDLFGQTTTGSSSSSPGALNWLTGLFG